MSGLGRLVIGEGFEEDVVGELGAALVDGVFEEAGQFGPNGAKGHALEEHGPKDVVEAFASSEVDSCLVELDVALSIELGVVLFQRLIHAVHDLS